MHQSNNLGYMLNHIAFMMGRNSDQVLQEQLGIGFSQFKIMMVLKWNSSIQQKQIAERLGQTEASISRQIKLLHKMGMLNTRIRPENKREHITSLTLKGEKLTEKALQILNNYHSPTFNSLTAKQQQNLLDALNAMHEVICTDKQSGFNHP